MGAQAPPGLWRPEAAALRLRVVDAWVRDLIWMRMLSSDRSLCSGPPLASTPAKPPAQRLRSTRRSSQPRSAVAELSRSGGGSLTAMPHVHSIRFDSRTLGARASTVASVLGAVDVLRGYRDHFRGTSHSSPVDPISRASLERRFMPETRWLPTLAILPAVSPISHSHPRFPNRTLHLTAGRPGASSGR